jgi:hypothetical protein
MIKNGMNQIDNSKEKNASSESSEIVGLQLEELLK